MKTIKLVLVLLVSISVSTFAQKRPVTLSQSEIKWTGNKVVGSHHGKIEIKSGYFDVKNNKIVAGVIVVDMNSITDEDLTDATYNQKLVGHLKSDDFFGVEKFPTATFTLTKVTAFKNNKATAWGKLTIKGKTENIQFEITKNGDFYSTQIKVDRSKFDVRYGSKSFFDNLGDSVIDDIFILDIKLLVK